MEDQNAATAVVDSALKESEELDAIASLEEIEALLDPAWRRELAASLMLEHVKTATHARYNRIGNHAAKNVDAERRWKDDEMAALGAIAAIRRDHKGVDAIVRAISTALVRETQKTRAAQDAEVARERA